MSRLSEGATKRNKHVNRVELFDGILYHYFAGPYSETMHAVEHCDSFFAEGLLSDSDMPMIRNRTIYIRGE